MLLHDDIVTQRQAETSAFSSWFCREKRRENLLAVVVMCAVAIVFDFDYGAIGAGVGSDASSAIALRLLSCSSPGPWRECRSMFLTILSARRPGLDGT